MPSSTVTARKKKKLMQNGRCFRCSSTERLSQVCKVERGCFKRGQNHHQSIFFSGKARNWENSSHPAGAEDKFRTDKVSKGSDREQRSSLSSSSGVLVILETAVIGVSNVKDEACRGQIFLDNCSLQSYITEEYAGRCRFKVVGHMAFWVNAFGCNEVHQNQQKITRLQFRICLEKRLFIWWGWTLSVFRCWVHATYMLSRDSIDTWVTFN